MEEEEMMMHMMIFYRRRASKSDEFLQEWGNLILIIMARHNLDTGMKKHNKSVDGLSRGVL